MLSFSEIQKPGGPGDEFNFSELERPRSEAAEVDPENPFSQWGYENGDKVEYQLYESQPRQIVELELSTPAGNRAHGGAWFYYHDEQGAKYNVLKTPSSSPQKCFAHSFHSPEHAQAAFPVQLKNITSETQLFSLIDAMERSGVLPENLNLHIPIKGSTQWEKLKNALIGIKVAKERNKVEALQQFVAVITRTNDLRAAVQKIYELDPLLQGLPPNKETKDRRQFDSPEQQIKNMLPRERVQIYNPQTQEVEWYQKLGDKIFYKEASPTEDGEEDQIGNARVLLGVTAEQLAVYALQRPEEFKIEENEILRSQVILRKEKAEQLDSLAVGDTVVIGENGYLKINSDQFQLVSLTPEAEATSIFTIVNVDILRERILNQFTVPQSVEFRARNGNGKSKIKETAEEREILSTSFAIVAKKLYGMSDGPKLVERIRKSEIQQGGYGDCYLLAAINSIKKSHPELYRDLLTRSIRFNKNSGNWQVRFLGAAQAKKSNEASKDWFTVSQEDIRKWRMKGASADEADIILECAYASYISTMRTGERGHTKELDADGDIAFEGGFGHRALADLLGGALAKKMKTSEYSGAAAQQTIEQNKDNGKVINFFRLLYKNNPKKFVVTANSPYRSKKDGQRGDARYLIYNESKVYYSHAYSVTKFEDEQVFLENPHDTSKPFSMPIHDFMKHFSQLSYVELVGEYEPV